MFNVSGLSLWSALIHPLFHTTQMDKEIFYHHYCPSFKPKIIIVDRQWGSSITGHCCPICGQRADYYQVFKILSSV